MSDDCYQEVNDCVKGDKLRIVCRKKNNWKKRRHTGQHNAQVCVVEKNAKATIVRAYTNVKE